MRRLLACVLALGVLVAASMGGAAVLCKKKSGSVVVRSACKAKESALDLTEFGAVGPTGATGAAGPGARWAQVAVDGTIVAQSGGITALAMGGGGYMLDFGSSLAGKAALVTSTLVTGDTGLRGAMVAVICGSGALSVCTVVPGTDDDHHVFVGASTAGEAGTEDHAFYVVVL